MEYSQILSVQADLLHNVKQQWQKHLKSTAWCVVAIMGETKNGTLLSVVQNLIEVVHWRRIIWLSTNTAGIITSVPCNKHMPVYFSKFADASRAER